VHRGAEDLHWVHGVLQWDDVGLGPMETPLEWIFRAYVTYPESNPTLPQL